ncbi:Gamma-glutamylcyclotransferase family protein [Heracleum sosnowskyi]|uniref:Gamma-glutamylcyclotransferase family protein n=1 Tax=Heracleum sosnowskyi TaxID=360622 RepID=A0AAD8MB56_9APIA|nr:Gamma-glutamylcyclotransferase family protein [Heracleum sosnowskyi]
MGGDKTEKKPNQTLIFTYGTLKRGFPNHNLLVEMLSSGDADFLGVHTTADKLPLVCGPFKVPFLLNFPGSGNHVVGELYALSDKALVRIDELEGVSTGHYERMPVRLHGIELVQAYYGHQNYAMDLWKRNGEIGFECYTEVQAKGYVRRGDRPRGVSFLDHINNFVSSSN